MGNQTLKPEQIKLILHIGQHKTGSKALQAFLAEHANSLRRTGILYPQLQNAHHNIQAYKNSHYRLFALLRREALVNAGEPEEAMRFWNEQSAFCYPFNSVHELFTSFEKERLQAGAKTLVLSAEDLFDMHTAHETEFSLSLISIASAILTQVIAEFGYDPMIVIYLRRQDYLLGAHYSQYIKGNPSAILDFDSFADKFSARLDSYNILIPWSEYFGGERILIRPYESSNLPFGIVPDFFIHALGFPVPVDWVLSKQNVETINASPDRDFLEFIRIQNKRALLGLATFNHKDVLKTALLEPTYKHNTKGISSWLSPSSRRALLDIHEHNNSKIVKLFMTKKEKSLFSEELPQENDNWSKYNGLSAERAIEIATRLHKIHELRQSKKWKTRIFYIGIGFFLTIIFWANIN
jgi:hypothetical protein